MSIPPTPPLPSGGSRKTGEIVKVFDSELSNKLAHRPLLTILNPPLIMIIQTCIADPLLLFSPLLIKICNKLKYPTAYNVIFHEADEESSATILDIAINLFSAYKSGFTNFSLA